MSTERASIDRRDRDRTCDQRRVKAPPSPATAPTWTISGPERDRIRAIAAAVVAGAHDERIDPELLEELAAVVLDVPEVRLALDVRDGGPLAVRHALELAARLLDATAVTSAAERR